MSIGFYFVFEPIVSFLMRSCIFNIHLDVLLCIYTSLSTFRNPKSGSSITTPALYIVNEWPNFKEYIVAIEDEEWEEKNMGIHKINRTRTSLEAR